MFLSTIKSSSHKIIGSSVAMQCVLLDHRDTVSHYLTGVYLYNLIPMGFTQAHQISFSYTYVSFLLLKLLKYLISLVARLNEHAQ